MQGCEVSRVARSAGGRRSGRRQCGKKGTTTHRLAAKRPNFEVSARAWDQRGSIENIHGRVVTRQQDGTTRRLLFPAHEIGQKQNDFLSSDRAETRDAHAARCMETGRCFFEATGQLFKARCRQRVRRPVRRQCAMCARLTRSYGFNTSLAVEHLDVRPQIKHIARVR